MTPSLKRWILKNRTFFKKQNFNFSLLFLIFLFLPFQSGPHFWPSFSFVEGIRVDYLSPTIYATDIGIILLCISFLFSFKKQNTPFKKTIKQYFLLLLFIVWIFLGTLFSRNPDAGLFGVVKFWEFLFLGFFILKNFPQEKIKNIFLLSLKVGVVFQTILATLQFMYQKSMGGVFYFFGERAFTQQTIGIANTDIGGQLLVRPYATFPHPNVLAGFLLLSLIFILLTNRDYKKKKEYYRNSSILLLGTWGLFITFSRISILLWITIVGGFLLKNVLKKKKQLYPFIISGISVFVLFLLFLIPFRERFVAFSFFDESLVFRIKQIEIAFHIIQGHILQGVGIHNYLFHVHDFSGLSNYYEIQPVHNMYLLLFAQIGIIGFLFFIYFVFKTTQKLSVKIKEKNKSLKYFYNGVSVSFFAILVISLFDHYFLTLQQGQLLLVIISSFAWKK